LDCRGEGNFYVNISKSKQLKVGNTVQLKLSIAQHVRDVHLLETLIKYLGTGNIEKNTNSPVVRIRISKL
jgi:hypothetical protein